jgi:hypothetical protein
MSNSHQRLDKQIAEGTAVETLKKRSIYEHGTVGNMPIMQRFVVIEAIFDPTIIDDVKIGYYEHTLGVTNIKYAKTLPRNTIIAKRVISSRTGNIPGSMFLFPLFPPNLSLPCQPGEHVWVMFENPTGVAMDLGYWMCRIVEPGHIDDINHTHAPRSLDYTLEASIKDTFEDTYTVDYEFRNGAAYKTKKGEKFTSPETQLVNGKDDAYEKLMLDSDAGKLQTYEPVPRFKKRPGDVSFEGSNNTLIVLGKDRVSNVANYSVDLEKGIFVDPLAPVPASDVNSPSAGAIDIVAGRGQTNLTLGQTIESKFVSGQKTGFSEILKTPASTIAQEGDPDFVNDKSRIYIAQKTRPDANLQVQNINQELSSGGLQGQPATLQVEKSSISDSIAGDGCIIVKSDKLRFIARSDIEILVTSYVEKDANGNFVASNNDDDFAVIAIKANGDIIFRPARHGYIKLGGDDANKGLVCSDAPVSAIGGNISGPPLVTTMGGLFAGSAAAGDDNGPALAAGQAKFANKILVK